MCGFGFGLVAPGCVERFPLHVEHRGFNIDHRRRCHHGCAGDDKRPGHDHGARHVYDSARRYHDRGSHDDRPRHVYDCARRYHDGRRHDHGARFDDHRARVDDHGSGYDNHRRCALA